MTTPDNSSRDRLATASLWLLLGVPALYQLSLFVYTIAARFGYDYDLEWMEGAMLHHAARISQGLAVYQQPSIDFIPFLYTPLYPASVAAAGSVFGISYQTARAISLLGIAVVMACVVGATLWALRRLQADAARADGSTTSWALGAAASLCGLGVYASGYPWTDAWYDIARVDSMLMAFITSALLGLRIWAPEMAARDGWRRWFDWRIAACAAALGLSFFIKQTGVIFVAAGGAALLALNWRAIPAFGAISGVIGLGGTYVYNRATDGWFWTYIYQYHQRHGASSDRFWHGLWGIWERYPAVVGLVGVAGVALIAYVATRRRLPRTGRCYLYWGWFFVVGSLVAATGLTTQWSVNNAYIPAIVSGAIAAAVSVLVLVEVAAELGPRFEGAASVLALGALAAQLAVLQWDTKPFVPTAQAEAAGDRLVERLRGVDGPVFVPFFPWYAHLAGKEMTAHRMNITDVTHLTPRHCPPPGKKPAEDKCVRLPEGADHVAGLDAQLRQEAYALAILDKNPIRRPYYHTLARHYRLEQMLPDDEYPVPVTAHKPRGLAIWRPTRPLERPDDARVVFDFESPRLDGWQFRGRAWGRGPTTGRLDRQQPIGAYGGQRLMNSYHGADDTTGTATSPPFELTGNTLVVHVGGGSAQEVRVELQATDGKVLRTARGQNSEILRPVRWDVSQWRGRKVRLVLVDESRSGWGHLLVDEVWQLP